MNCENRIHLLISCFWRLFINDEIKQKSTDNNTKFRFGEPKIDLSVSILATISNSLLIKIEHEIKTGDLVLYFEDYKKNYISSMAFEDWNLHVDNKQYVSLAGGVEIVIWS